MSLDELIASERQRTHRGPTPDLCRVGRVLATLPDEDVKTLADAADELTAAGLSRILTRIDGSTVSWSSTARHYSGECCCG